MANQQINLDVVRDVETRIDALINSAPQKSQEAFALAALPLLFDASEYLGRLVEQYGHMTTLHEQAIDVLQQTQWALAHEQQAHDSLKEQLKSLELACDHHKMFWQKAEERERGLKEQLEAAERERNSLFQQANAQGAWMTGAIPNFQKVAELQEQLGTWPEEQQALHDRIEELQEQLEATRKEADAEHSMGEDARRVGRELMEQLEALNAENAKLNIENRDLLEKWSARGRVVDAARVILILADEERDELAGEVSKYLGPWADLVEAVHAVSNPATTSSGEVLGTETPEAAGSASPEVSSPASGRLSEEANPSRRLNEDVSVLGSDSPPPRGGSFQERKL